MAAIDFPNSPTVGQVFTAGSSTWTWDGAKWASGIAPYTYLPVAGGTMQGPLLLARDPVATAEASTKNYVDNQDSLHLLLTGGTLTGDLTINSTDGNNLILNSGANWPGIEFNIPAAGKGAWLGSYLGGKQRWELDLGNGIAESGANAGSNFQIARYADDGTFLDDPIIINRQTGVASFSQPIQAPQGLMNGFVNKLRNPGFEIAQRGASVPTPGGGAALYTLDGWMFVNGGSAMTVNRGQTAPPPGAGRFYLQMLGAAGVTSAALLQRIESVVSAPLCGQTCTFQMLVFNATAATITPSLSIFHPNTLDNYAAQTTDQTITLQPCPTGVWTKVAATVNVPIASQLLGVGVQVNWPVGVLLAATSISVANADFRATPGVALGLNANPPPVELRPWPIEQTFNYRYYVSTGVVFLCKAYSASVTGFQSIWSAPVQMRGPPTISGNNFTGITNATNGAIGCLADNRTCYCTFQNIAAGDYWLTWTVGNLSSEI